MSESSNRATVEGVLGRADLEAARVPRQHLTRILAVRRWIAAGFLAVVVVGYPIAWQADPYIFGIAGLAFVPLQLAVALVGIIARITRLDPVGGLQVQLIDGLLIAGAAGALAAVRSISWA